MQSGVSTPSVHQLNVYVGVAFALLHRSAVSGNPARALIAKALADLS